MKGGKCFKKIGRFFRNHGFSWDMIGTHFESKFWFNRDECGIVCCLIAYGIILYAQAVVSIVILNPWRNSNFLTIFQTVIFNAIAELAKLSHWRAMTTDPGAVPRDALPLNGPNHWTVEWELNHDESEEDSMAMGLGGDVRPRRKVCRRCHTYKPPRAHHCSQCRRCIIKMDHHCPWVNNCVGLRNHKFFLLFLLYVNWLCLYSIVLGLLSLMLCGYNPKDPSKETCGHVSKILTLGLLVMASMFALFTFCMICDQYDAVSSNLTKIDRLKGETHEIQEDINEVFGGKKKGFNIFWLIPTLANYPRDRIESMHGYRILKDDAIDMNIEEGLAIEMSHLHLDESKSMSDGSPMRRGERVTPLYRASRIRPPSELRGNNMYTKIEDSTNHDANDHALGTFISRGGQRRSNIVDSPDSKDELLDENDLLKNHEDLV